MRSVIAVGCLLVAFFAVSTANPVARLNEQDTEEAHSQFRKKMFCNRGPDNII